MSKTGRFDCESLPELSTPCLVIDERVLDRNLRAMQQLLRRNGAVPRLRPHAKAHKCAEIARLQLALGAVGICCQTVAEAEAFASRGIEDVLITNQIGDAGKARRVAAIAASTKVAICIDAPEQVALLAAAARSGNVHLGVYIEVDVGGGRCGVATIEDALVLARLIANCDTLRLSGLQAYQGRAQHAPDARERKEMVAAAAAKTRAFAGALVSGGHELDAISGGGTGTLAHDLEFGTLSELQCGSYALMDSDYLRVLGPDPFAPSLTVLSRVISVNHPQRPIVDAGLKAVALDSGPPAVRGLGTAEYRPAGDEHGLICLPAGTSVRNGDIVELIPGHCDPTVALHSILHVLNDGRLTASWPVIARGEW